MSRETLAEPDPDVPQFLDEAQDTGVQIREE